MAIVEAVNALLYIHQRGLNEMTRSVVKEGRRFRTLDPTANYLEILQE